MQHPAGERSAMTSRTVSRCERGGKPVRAVTIKRRFEGSVSNLWKAVTVPERLSGWFLPITGDLREGGNFQFEGNARGAIIECQTERFLSLTWEFGGGLSWLELGLADESASGCSLSLSHIVPADDHWKEFGAGAAGVGWDLSLMGLAAHLEGVKFDDNDQNNFATTPEGKSFIAQWSEAWRQAAIAAGEDAIDAENAAKRTTAFYSGEQ